MAARSGGMSALGGARAALAQIGVATPVAQITQYMLDHGLWSTTGKTPVATVHAQIAVDIKKHGDESAFRRVAPGVFALAEGAAPEQPPLEVAVPSTAPPSASASPMPAGGTDSAHAVGFREAALVVLREAREPLHYREITKRAIAAGLVSSDGKTPEATLAALIGTDIRRRKQRGEVPVFTKVGRGVIGLAEWGPQGLAVQIERHNLRVRKELHSYLMGMTPTEFEELVAALLTKLGFEAVSATPPSGDGGIDARGTLVVAGSINVRMAVQVKRWKSNVQAPTVQQVRGSLGAHEQGLIITTSSFSDGSRAEARRADASPVALIDGDQLLSLLIENELLVRAIDQPKLLELHPHPDVAGEALLDAPDESA